MHGKSHLAFAVVIYVPAMQWLSRIDYMHDPLLVLMMLLAMGAGRFPDIDLWFMIYAPLRYVNSALGGWLHHRSPITHSFIIPLVLYFGIQWSPVALPFFQAFLLGVFSHLLGDVIKVGNIVKIPAKYEKLWFVINAGICVWILAQTGFFKPFSELSLPF